MRMRVCACTVSTVDPFPLCFNHSCTHGAHTPSTPATATMNAPQPPKPQPPNLHTPPIPPHNPSPHTNPRPQVWEYDKNLLQADALPLVGAYKYETATYMRCLALDEFLPAVLAAGRRLALQLLSQGPASSGEGAAAGAGGDRDPDSLTGIGGKGGKGGAARGPRGAGAAAAAAAAGVGGAHMLGPGALGGGGPGGGGGPVGGGGITRKILRKGSRITQVCGGLGLGSGGSEGGRVGGRVAGHRFGWEGGWVGLSGFGWLVWWRVGVE